MVFPEEWDFKAPITVSPSQVAGTSGAFADFPVLLTAANLPPDMLDADGPAPAQSDGGDIRFSADAEGAEPIPCDIRIFAIDPDPLQARANLVVRAPVLSKSDPTTIWVWWSTEGTDSQPAATDPLGRNAVYSALVSGGQGAVYNASAGLADLTGNGFDLTMSGDVSTVAGLNGDAWRFDLDASKGLEASAPITGNGVPSTLSVLATRESAGGWRALVEIALNNNNRFGLWHAADETASFWQAPSISSSLTGPVPALRDFSYISGVKTSGERRLLLDGGVANTLAETQHPSGVTTLRIGRRFDNTLPADSKIEEIRIAALALPDDWITTEANNLRDVASFAAAGAVENTGIGFTGAADPRLTGMAAMAIGHQRNDAAGGAFIPSLRAAAGAQLRHAGSTASITRAPRLHATGTLRNVGPAGPAWGRLLVSASGVVALPVSGALATQLPALAATASGQRSFVALSSASLPGLVGDGDGWIGLGPQPASSRLEIARTAPRLIRARAASRKLTAS